MKRAAIFSVLLILAGTAHAASSPPQSAAGDTAEPRDVYDIELIIFEHQAQGLAEDWPQEPGEPDRLLAQGALTPAQRRSLPGGSAQNTLPGDIVLLEDEQVEFKPVAYSLRRADKPVHLHIAWRQPVQDRDSPTWLWVETERLRGLVRMTRGRFLHLDTDLLLELPDTAQTYRVRLHRRMRREETHYLDHPKLGMIVRALRYEAPEAVDEPTPDTGDPGPDTADTVATDGQETAPADPPVPQNR